MVTVYSTRDWHNASLGLFQRGDALTFLNAPKLDGYVNANGKKTPAVSGDYLIPGAPENDPRGYMPIRIPKSYISDRKPK